MNAKKLELATVLKIAFTYIGAVIGAGFASGQEIFQFFVKYGRSGFTGMVLAGILFIVCGVIFLQLAGRMRVSNYYQIFYQVMGKRWGVAVDIIYTLFTLGSISVMLAGSGGVFQEVLGVKYSLGVFITLAVVMVTVAAGIRGVLWLNTFLIPFLIVMVFYTCLAHLGAGTHEALAQLAVSGKMPWFLSGMVYVAFNIFLSLAVLTRIGSEVKARRTLNWGGILGGVFLLLLILVMGSTMFVLFDQIRYEEMPMLAIADMSGPVQHVLYMIVLWIALITTAVANVYGFMERMRSLLKLNYYNTAMLTIVVVLPLTRFGFGNLVGFLYPLYGVVALVVLLMLGIRVIWKRG